MSLGNRVRPAVKAYLRFSSAAARTAAIATVKLAEDPLAVGEVLDVRDLDEEDAKPRWIMLERHVTRATVDTLRDRLRDVLTNAACLNGSRVQVHDCGHDDTPQTSCAVLAEWRKVGGSIVRII